MDKLHLSGNSRKKTDYKIETLSDYIVSVLAAHGIKHVFGYPGASILPLMAAVDVCPATDWILMRNEAGASMAASAYAKLTGSLAVCMATSGPGATNLISGLVDAQTDSVPLLAITGMVSTWKQGRFEFQDIDSAKVISELVPYSVQCTHPDQLPAMLRDCLGRAEQERCVVHLSIAHDVQAFRPTEQEARFRTVYSPEKTVIHMPEEKTIRDAANFLSESRHVVVAVGPRARNCGANIEALAHKLNSPVITSYDGKGIINENHRCSLGVLGIFGSPGVEMAQQVVSAADTILAFGLTDLGPFLTGQDGVQIRQLIQCEPDFSTVSNRFHREYTLVGPLAELSGQLAKRVRAGHSQELLNKATDLHEAFYSSWKNPAQKNAGFIHPVEFLSVLNEYLDENTVLSLDTGDNAVWAAQFLRLPGPQPVLVSENLGAMGFSLPAVIAARLASPQKKVVGICGDGGLQMTIGELGTAMQYNLNFVLVVFNNGILGRIHAQQEHPFGCFIKNPDFVKLAQAYQGDGQTVTSVEEARKALECAFEHKSGPFILDVRCPADVFAPMSKWEDGFKPIHFS